MQTLMDEGIILPILSAHSDFRAPLYYDDPPTITSAIAEVKTRSIRIDHTVQSGDGWNRLKHSAPDIPHI
ncbi:MAG: hypothetical protein K6T63_15990 [Alicyclobacillus herbarius]|uniref:acyl-CoA thioesterase n=1 Tax=Alicyclobacillus herbarius TaxID=122960 RepID=UPI0023542732|nr:hotdog domain-containing protein [Alicyclobacillus herbarius]MCL6634112.1 hypothetical protein [Alicyclobacillus herbarius]